VSVPANLPTVGEYLAAAPWAWSWLASVPAEFRTGAHVVDLTVHPAPGELLGDEWQPVAEHPERPVYLVRLCTVLLVALLAVSAVACGGPAPIPFALVACDDGSGNVDCCPDSVLEGASCDNVAAQCGTRCGNDGNRAELTCNGVWVVGSTTVPCGPHNGP
jgi:hypothetical protein